MRRKYLSIERLVKRSSGLNYEQEAKATALDNKSKSRLFRVLNNTELFGGVVVQPRVHEHIFLNRKSKQRYLDFVYNVSLKRKFEFLIRMGRLNPADVTSLQVCVDEHATATDGRYELQEALEQEFKVGTFNYMWTQYFPPIFPNIQNVSLRLYDSKVNTLIRAADIVANHIYHDCMSGGKMQIKPNLHITNFP